ncbi:hypothetical protein KM043_016528 [Ampulex compressa]|nr:hypothetical protein KM043_016528 [Ampulex compressa]
MQRAKFFKKFLMPCGLCAAVPVVKPASPSQECAENCSHDLKTKKLIRPSELPIYVEDINQQMPCADHVPSALELQVGEVRRSLQGVRDQYRYINDSFSSVIDTGKEHSRFMLDYLREESNILPRIGAVGIGSLSGLILGLRGGTFKRLVYSSTGAAAVGAVCYPKKAEEGVVLMKYYTNVVYNFVYGIKPGDDKQLQYTLPELPKLSVPTSISEAFEMVANAGSGIATAIGSLSQKAITTLNEKKEEKEPVVESSDKKK